MEPLASTVTAWLHVTAARMMSPRLYRYVSPVVGEEVNATRWIDAAPVVVTALQSFQKTSPVLCQSAATQ